MASSLHDPHMAHSLWLQRRSSRRGARRALWRSDWTPLGVVMILLGLLMLLALFVPSNEAVEKAKQAAKDQRTGSQEASMVGVAIER